MEEKSKDETVEKLAESLVRLEILKDVMTD